MPKSTGLLGSEAEGHSPPQIFSNLLIESEAGYRVFFRKLKDTVFPLGSRPQEDDETAAFLWSEVFVDSGLPWGRLAESFILHIAAIVAVWGASRALLLRPYAVPQVMARHADVIYYTPSEYLPPIDTGTESAHEAQKGDPEYSKQPIISVPAEADNKTQTIVTPPDIKLKHDVPMPNVVAWDAVTPAVPMDATSELRRNRRQDSPAVIEPAPTIEQASDRRRLDLPQTVVVAPAPDIVAANSRGAIAGPESAIIAPPPEVRMAARQAGQINIGYSEVIAPAPALPVGEQRAVRDAALSEGNLTAAVVPPPPSVKGTRSRGVLTRGIPGSGEIVPPPPGLPGAGSGNQRIVALGIHPDAAAPPVAQGNRRGTFAATPEGKIGSSGAPEIKASAINGRGGSSGLNGRGSARDQLPSGLMVGAAPDSSARPGASAGTLVADTKPIARVTSGGHRAVESDSPPSAAERQVFGPRKFYSMQLNMPNLNSAGGGSWVIRFAELKDQGERGELIAPELTRKVDPAYPLELMRSNIEGTVTLYAVVHSDGHVSDVRVINSVDDRLDSYAGAALSRWEFRPAIRNGSPVPIAAVVTIPFRAHRPF